MTCEIINIGKEFLRGQKKECSSWVAASAVSAFGIEVRKIITLADEKDEIVSVLNSVINENRILVLIGGMGSTPDDITREAVSQFTGRELVFSMEAMENVAAFFAKRRLEVPEECRNQANIIAGAKVLKNTKGSSPGQFIEENNKIIVLLPGPPEEVSDIVEHQLVHILRKRFEEGIRKVTNIHVLGMCEVEVAKKIKDILETERKLEGGEVDFYFDSKIEGTDLIISVSGSDEMLVDELMHKTKAEVYSEIGDCICGENKESLEIAVGRMLTKKRKTISIAESCTGGLLSSKITDAPGSSVYFKHSEVVYSTNSKIKQLGISEKIIKKFSAVSSETAKEMANKIRKKAQTDISLAVTGYAGPGSPEGSKAGEGYISLSTEKKTDVKKVFFSGDRKLVKEKFALEALILLWKYLKA